MKLTIQIQAVTNHFRFGMIVVNDCAIALHLLTFIMKEIEMGKFNKHQGDRDRLAKCEICLEYISIDYLLQRR